GRRVRASARARAGAAAARARARRRRAAGRHFGGPAAHHRVAGGRARALACAVALLLLAGRAPAQDPALEAVRSDVLAAIAAAQGGRPADLRAARDRLDAAEARIPAIADPTKQAQARLFIAVRRADLLLRAAEPNLDKAAALVRAARETGRADGVWDGVSQEAGLLILWQTLPANEFFELVTSAPEDRAVVEGERPASPDHVLPLRLV